MSHSKNLEIELKNFKSSCLSLLYYLYEFIFSQETLSSPLLTSLICDENLEVNSHGTDNLFLSHVALWKED